MTVGAFVLPPMSVGMTEASTTESPSIPRTRKRRVDDGQLIDAHAAGPDGMIDRVRAPADARDEGFVRIALLRKELGAAVRCERSAFHDVARTLDAREQGRDVRGLREEVRVDARRIERIGRTQPTLPRLFGRSTATWQVTP